MFAHQLPKTNKIFSVIFTEYAQSHYLKKFRKNYKGKQWEFTEISIKEDLSRLRMENNKTQLSDQIDEYKYSNNTWLAKYDFKIALTKESSKSSGNRCILYINDDKDLIEILMIYGKTDIPKNKNETAFVMDAISKVYGNKLKDLIVTK